MRIFEDFIDNIQDSEKMISDRGEQEIPSKDDYQYVLCSIGNRHNFPKLQNRLRSIFNRTVEVSKFCEYCPTPDSETQFYFNSVFRSPHRCLMFLISICKAFQDIGGDSLNVIFNTHETNYIFNASLVIAKAQHQFTPGTKTNVMFQNMKDFIDMMTDYKKTPQTIDLLISDYLDITNTLIYWVCSSNMNTFDSRIKNSFRDLPICQETIDKSIYVHFEPWMQTYRWYANRTSNGNDYQIQKESRFSFEGIVPKKTILAYDNNLRLCYSSYLGAFEYSPRCYYIVFIYFRTDTVQDFIKKMESIYNIKFDKEAAKQLRRYCKIIKVNENAH